MKEKELRECEDCNLCNEKIGKSGIPMFWRVKIERHGLDLNALERQTGLAMSMGKNMAPLAQIMGPDEEMTMPMMDPVTITVCETCAISSLHCVASMAEMSDP